MIDAKVVIGIEESQRNKKVLNDGLENVKMDVNAEEALVFEVFKN